MHEDWYYRIELSPGEFTPGRPIGTLRVLKKLWNDVDFEDKRVLDIGTMEFVAPILFTSRGAREIVAAAGDFTESHFRSADLAVEAKGDGTPVTLADRGAEQLLREAITAEFPDDALIGEEYGETPAASGRHPLDFLTFTGQSAKGSSLATQSCAGETAIAAFLAQHIRKLSNI